MERPPNPELSAEGLVEDLVRREADVVGQVRTLLEAHRERRLQLRRELHGLIGQFGKFPQTNNVHQLRLVRGGLADDVEISL
jgi:hypothetical protein